MFQGLVLQPEKINTTAKASSGTKFKLHFFTGL